jgi:hypothetical protein
MDRNNFGSDEVGRKIMSNATQVLERIKSLTAEEPPVLNVQAIAEAATKKVIEAISAAPSASESSRLQSSEPLPDVDDADVSLDEQTAALNEIDEADHSDGVSPEIPTIPTPKESLQLLQPVTIPPEIVVLLQAALRANLTHVVIKVLTILLQEMK